jgi:hypothetical protein
MYHFTLGDMECQCDTPDELRKICEGRSTRFVPICSRETRDAIPDPPTAKESTKANTREVFGIGSGTLPYKEPSREEVVKELPYVDEPLTWKVANRWAKKLGRKDVSQLRSDLCARKKMGK